MVELLKALSSDPAYLILEKIRENPGLNASSLAKMLNLHTATVQRYLEIFEKYGVIISEEKRKIGRPSKIYFYKGGRFCFDLENLLKIFSMRKVKVREREIEGAKYSFNVKKEMINSAILNGNIIRFDESTGRFLWNVPPPGSEGRSVEEIAGMANLSLMEASEIAVRLMDMGILEVVEYG